MKKFVLFLFLLCTILLVRAEEIQYETVYNIPYYSEAQTQSDLYKKERCMVDIYYPKNTKSFATVYEFQGYGHDMRLPAFPLLIQEVRKI